jgi:pimeloyl-ACP methyl ester carboxylesterase
MSFFLGHPLTRRPLWQRLPRMARFGLRLLFAQEGLLFQPRRELAAVPRDLGLDCREVELPLGRLGIARGWWVPGPDAGAPAVLFLPGAAGNLSDDLATLRFLHGLGAGVAALDYPGFGRSSGRPTVAGCYRTAEAGWRWLAGASPPPRRLIVYGRSFGCFLATRLAAAGPAAVGRPAAAGPAAAASAAAGSAAAGRAAGLVFHNGLSSIEDFVARVFPPRLVHLLCRIRLDSAREIGACACPALFMHARRDEVIPAELGRRVYERATAPRRWLDLPGGHFGADWQQPREVRQAFGELLAGKAAGWERPRSAGPGGRAG